MGTLRGGNVAGGRCGQGADSPFRPARLLLNLTLK